VDRINAIANPTLPKVGERFLGTVVKTDAVRRLRLPAARPDGLVHISKLGGGKRIGKVEDVANVGDKMQVEITDIEARGKISLVPVAEGGAEADAPARPRPLLPRVSDNA
jgi:polyribonucleotide nucleotidyltransferase